MSSSLDRRAFLRTMAAAGALPLVNLPTQSTAASVTPATSATPSGSERRVVVLGAGLAGLCTAYNLMNHGYDVIVLEAQDRPGGRVHTVRDGFEFDGYAEMSAVRIFDTHEYTLKCIDEFGLELTPYDTGTQAFYMQDQRFLAP